MNVHKNILLRRTNCTKRKTASDGILRQLLSSCLLFHYCTSFSSHCISSSTVGFGRWHSSCWPCNTLSFVVLQPSPPSISPLRQSKNAEEYDGKGDKSIEEAYRFAMEEDAEWYNEFVRTILKGEEEGIATAREEDENEKEHNNLVVADVLTEDSGMEDFQDDDDDEELMRQMELELASDDSVELHDAYNDDEEENVEVTSMPEELASDDSDYNDNEKEGEEDFTVTSMPQELASDEYAYEDYEEESAAVTSTSEELALDEYDYDQAQDGSTIAIKQTLDLQMEDEINPDEETEGAENALQPTPPPIEDLPFHLQSDIQYEQEEDKDSMLASSRPQKQYSYEEDDMISPSPYIADDNTPLQTKLSPDQSQQLQALGYPPEECQTLAMDALDLILQDSIRCPKTGIPNRWKQTFVYEEDVLVEERKIEDKIDDMDDTTPPPSHTRHPLRPKSRRRTPPPYTEDRRRTSRRSRNRPSQRSSTKDYDDDYDSNFSNKFWMSQSTFKSYLRREAQLRLAIMGPSWKNMVKNESQWRLGLYKKWLSILEDGVGEDVISNGAPGQSSTKRSRRSSNSRGSARKRRTSKTRMNGEENGIPSRRRNKRRSEREGVAVKRDTGEDDDFMTNENNFNTRAPIHFEEEEEEEIFQTEPNRKRGDSRTRRRNRNTKASYPRRREQRRAPPFAAEDDVNGC